MTKTKLQDTGADIASTQQEDYVKIRGGKALEGDVTVRGAKNSISKILVASLLTDETCTFHNMADVDDVRVVSLMIEAMGGTVTHDDQAGNGTIRVESKNLKPAPHETLKSIAGTSRIPILFAGPLLARTGEAFLPELGGCEIGPRPVDYHLQALQKMGARVEDIPRGFHMTAERLHGTKIALEYPSVGATEQVLLSAVLAEGVTELTGSAIEPEIIDLISLLQKMGANISVDTDRTITIIGVKKLHGTEHTAITDRIEVASWACAAALTNGRIFVRNARQLDIMTFLNKFRQAGGEFEVHDDGILFYRGQALRPVPIETDVHPGFMTDWQQPFTVLLTQSSGASVIHETVYEDRFGYTASLNDMGAKIQLHRECLGGKKCRFGQKNHFHSAIIIGPTPLRGSEIEVPNLRAGFSYIVAALSAEGVSTITNMRLIKRGYENFIGKLEALGADIVEDKTV